MNAAFALQTFLLAFELHWADLRAILFCRIYTSTYFGHIKTMKFHFLCSAKRQKRRSQCDDVARADVAWSKIKISTLFERFLDTRVVVVDVYVRNCM